ncbi:MAG: NAD(P)-dependent oxidoreductase, partial [Candidatus Heimdallarchaeota archaeon]
MRILVTGGTGFIGSHLIEKLVNENHETVCMVRRTSDTTLVDKLGVETWVADLGDFNSLKLIPRDLDLVYHLASYYTFLGKKELYIKYNEQGTKSLLDACEMSGVPHFIYCSSTEAIGAVPFANKKEDYATEEAPYNPQYEYGRSKVRTEELVKNHKGETAWTILRPTGVYGPRCIDDVSFWWIEALAKRKIPAWFRVRNAGTVHFTHVSDVVQGFYLARKKKAKNQIFNISSDECKSVDEVMKIVCKYLGRKPPRFALPKFMLKIAVAPFQAFNEIRRKPEFFMRTAA